ncbi:MAG: hypothetical protein KGL18_14285 [Burkholderiales bacterium]|nr:hypothetical protein [Burkholderiales bacterium]MDE1927792.1 hypothetical protein [Burkholderiales bacterium]MDE2158153.1 hypothetical protein [Burkholderiales bacterium]MDE2504127.1 hypothetical protein [Burkholderiales bacterium]
MNDVVIPGAAGEQDGLRTLTHVLYGLHLLSWFSAGIFSVIAMIINYVKRPDLPNDFYRSHYRWQARSFWFTLLWLLLTLPLYLFMWFPGAAAWFLIGIWYLYRYIRGWLGYAENRTMPLPAN